MDNQYFIAIMVILIPVVIARIIMTGAQRKLSDEQRIALLDMSSSRGNVTLIIYLLFIALWFVMEKMLPEKYESLMWLYLMLVITTFIIGSVLNYRKIRMLLLPEAFTKRYWFSRFLALSGIVAYVIIMLSWNNAAPSDSNVAASQYAVKGYQEIMNKKYGEAVLLYDSAIAIQNDVSLYFLNRGIAFYYLGDLQSACIDWTHAFAMGDALARSYLENYCH